MNLRETKERKPHFSCKGLKQVIELFEQTRTMDQTAWLVNDASRIDFQRGVQVHMQSELLKPTIRPITLVQQRTTHTPKKCTETR